MEVNEMVKKLKCNKCGWVWTPFVQSPVKCPNCQTKKWNKEGDEGESIRNDNI